MDPRTDTLAEDKVYGDVLRTLVRQENDLTNHRTTWLLATQGILFAAASAVIREYVLPLVVIGAVGILTAWSIGHALKNSEKSRLHLKGLWRHRLEKGGYAPDQLPPLDGGFPDLKPKKWLQPWNFVPKVVSAAWAILIVYALVNGFTAAT